MSTPHFEFHVSFVALCSRLNIHKFWFVWHLLGALPSSSSTVMAYFGVYDTWPDVSHILFIGHDM